jgi:hypothetical protein
MAPSFFLAVIVATGVGLVYSIWRGGHLTRMALFVVAAWIGFAVGQLIGAVLGLHVLLIGEVHLLEGILGSLIVLVLVGRPAEA